MVLATALGISVVILLATILPPQRLHSWLPVVLALLPMALMFVYQPVMRWMSTQAGWITSLATALLNPRQLALVVLLLGGASLAISLVGYRIFEKAFYGGWNRLRETPKRPAREIKKFETKKRSRRWMQLLPISLHAIVVKEWQELRRDPFRLIGLLGTPLLFIPLLWPLLRQDHPLHTLSFWFLLASGLMLQTSVVMDALTTIGREGRSIELFRSAPLPMGDVLRGKFWGAAWSLAVVIWSLSYIIIGLLAHFPIWQIGFLVGTLALGLLGAASLSTAYGALTAKFSVEDPAKQSVSLLHQWGALLLSGIFMLLTFTTTVWLLVNIFPESDVVLPIKAMASFPAVGWLLADINWLPIVFVASQVVFWVGVRALLKAAIRRLERVEV
jgi:hypothetical protein